MQIINVGQKFVNVYLVKIGESWCLIDTGYKQTNKKLYQKIQESGVKLEEIKYVFLTHHHADHAGNLADILLKTGAQLISAKENEARLRAGKNDMDTYVSSFTMGILGKISTTFVNTTQCFPPVTVDDYLLPEMQPLGEYGARFIKLKGHTDCDIALMIEDCLFCGDLFCSCFGAERLAPFWLKNKFELLKSWNQISLLDTVKTIYPCHGKPFSVKKVAGAINYWQKKGVFRLSL